MSNTNTELDAVAFQILYREEFQDDLDKLLDRAEEFGVELTVLFSSRNTNNLFFSCTNSNKNGRSFWQGSFIRLWDTLRQGTRQP